MILATDNEATVVVRRRWNATDSAAVSCAALWNIHFRNEAGGVCGAAPRAFLCAQVWCDQCASGALGHHCGAASSPHELLVWISPRDNPPALYERLRDCARGGRSAPI